jgi:4-amino-4-deoxy-L-arabinose transferase-like glycosyltransferase
MESNGFIKSGPVSFLQNRGHLILLALIALLSFGLNFFAISKLGYCNAYYAAAIRSMTESFHNFFFVSFDPAGVVSVDKPPLGLWVQALFVLVFGYHGWAMLLPQALAGTGSCLMMYKLTSRYFGRAAALISALVFALTPAAVVARATTLWTCSSSSCCW